MTVALVVCPSCARHVHIGESSCPFCASALPAGLVAKPHGPRRPYYGKGATALALASALAATGCGSDDKPANTTDSGAEAAADSASSTDSSATDSAADSSSSDVSDSEVADDASGVPLYK